MERTATSLGVATSALILLLALVCDAAAGGAVEVPQSWELGVMGVGEGKTDMFIFADGDGNTVVQRVLQGVGGGYISYCLLWRDSVPCSVQGASCYNYRPGAQGNPYSCGCSAITHCCG